MNIFDRKILRLRRDRAAEKMGSFDFLLKNVADNMVERLDIIRKSFPLTLDLGGAHGVLSERLVKRNRTANVITSDVSFGMISRSDGDGPLLRVVADEEFLPFKNQSLDAIVSNLSLQWVNDLPGALTQIKAALKPDGLFLAAVMGGETLKELRACLMEAELNMTGGASPRVSPFIDLRDMGALLQRAGFSLPVVDSDTITVDYSHPLKLMEDLRGMGASNATVNRLRKPTRRAVMLEAVRLYQERYADAAGLVPASFQIIYAIGWAPHESQQKPLIPGSAKARLAEALKTTEIPAGEKP